MSAIKGAARASCRRDGREFSVGQLDPYALGRPSTAAVPSTQEVERRAQDHVREGPRGYQ